MRKTCVIVLVTLVTLLANSAAHGQPLFGGSKEYRSTSTDVYTLKIQKNGRTDVSFINGKPIFDDVHPEVWYDGKDEPSALSVDGRYTMREGIKNPLGEGQGMIYAKGNCEWHIQAYPTQPFFTVQVFYTNMDNDAKTIRKLIPFAVGSARKGGLHLGPHPEDVRILEDGRMFQIFSDYVDVVRGQSSSQWNLAMLNPHTGQSVIAGFLTHTTAYTQIAVDDAGAGKESDAFGLFRAECVYDPPVTLEPGGTLTSEILYVAVGEQSPLEGLERYGRAVAAFYGKPKEPAFLPHGWDPWSTELRANISEAALLEDLDVLDKELKRYGYDTFAIDDGWEVARGDWEANERFPQGMKWLADEIHRRGLHATLWISPFIAAKDSALAKEHPEWMREANRRGRLVMGDDQYIIDVTAPGAYEWVRDLAHKITQEWGYDGIVEADFVYFLLFADHYHDTARTGVEVLRLGMQALREGMGRDDFLMATVPHMVTGQLANGIRVGTDCAPIWHSKVRTGPWGAVDALTQAARRYYFDPLFAMDQDCLFFGKPETRARWDVESEPMLTRDQQRAWLTGAAMTGGVVKIGDRYSRLDAEELGMMRKIMPVLEQPARPIDLFEQYSPRIWALPVQGADGDLLLVGAFNWDEKNSQTVSLDFNTLGLGSANYYAVFEFWSQKYYGAAKGQLNVQLTPASMGLYGLRAFRDRPMLLSSDRHYAMGQLEFTDITWDDVANTLRGTFDGVADTDYTLHFLVPEPYTVADVAFAVEDVTHSQNAEVLKVKLHVAEVGPVAWSITFTK